MRASATRAIASSPRAARGAVRASQRARPPSRTGWPRPSLTVTRRPLLPGSTAVGVVSLHDLLHELMADDILLVEPDELDALDVADDLHGFDQARGAARGQVDLRDVAGDHRLGPEAQAREEHLHLLAGGVLRFVEDDEGIVERPSAHEGDGGDFDRAALEEAVGPLDVEHVVERVVQRTQIRVHLLLQIAGQEPEL